MSKTFIEELKIEGLGVFNKEKTEKFNKNFNLIKDKRENGKTTLIKSMLWNLLDKEFEYLESIAEHKSSYSSLLINNNNISSKIIKNMVGNIECDNEELLEYKQQISKFSDLLFINDINFSTELTPNEILKEYDNININKKIENTIKEYEDLTNELYSNNIEEEYNEKQKIFKIEIESLKDLINKNNILKEKMTLLTNEKKEIQNKQIKAEIYEELKNNYHSLISEYNLFKILLKLKLNNVDINDQEVDTTLELKEIVNSTLISMVDKIKEHFSDKVKNINENFLNLFLDIEEYRHILETLNYIEKYNINDIEYFFNNIEKIKSDITQIIEMEEISDNDEEVLSFVEENFDNELKSIINIFNDSYNEILKFIKYLELSISSKTLESMISYYEIESNDYEKLINLNNKYPYFIVYQINNNFKSEVKSSFKNSISLEFNEQFIGSIENILSGYFEHLQKIKIKFLTDEENNIINNNEEFFSKNISIDEII
jgi:hypothetical protein